ncbi:MAG: DNA polymerase III subunit chi [Gammaproteobacteria bacterium]|nr:DNA polymerase III subunit chi [Gammaproteobacteria bacterium]
MNLRVDFYITQAHSEDERLRVVCRLTEKAIQAGESVFIFTGDDSQGQRVAKRVDELLWTFRDCSFIPHQMTNGDERTYSEVAVSIGHDSSKPKSTAILVNLSEQVPDSLTDYPRLLEVIAADEASKAAGRTRFKGYRDQGCELHTHNI